MPGSGVQNDSPSASLSEEQHKISRTRMNIVIFIMLLIDLLGFTVILPLLPKLLEYYGKDGSDNLYSAMQKSVIGFRELVGAPDTPKWNSVLFGGFIGSMFSMLQFIASPIIGAASDVYGRKPLLLLTSMGIALSYILWAVSKNFTIFVISRIIGGLAKGNVSLSTAVVADINKEGERGKGMAAIGIAFSVGFLLGPMIGAGFAGSHINVLGNSEFFVAPALFSLMMALADILYIYCSFEESLPKDKRTKSLFNNMTQMFYLINPISLFGFSAVRNATKQEYSSMRKIGVIYFMYLFLYSGLEFTLTFLTFLRFNYTSMQQGKLFFIIGLVMITVQGGYTRRQKGGTEIKTAIIGLLLLIPAFVCIGYSTSATQLYLGVTLFAFASATVVPSMTTMISNYGSASQKGAVMGVFRSLGALARALGPIVASAGYWSFGAEKSYCIGAALLIIPLIGLFTIKAKVPEKSA